MTIHLSKKSLIVAVSIMLISAMSIGSTLAYFTDLGQVTNTFTVGQVKIELEEDWDEEDGIDKVPGDTVVKKPTVTAGEGESWMFLEVTLIDSASGAMITDKARADEILETLYYDGNSPSRIAVGTSYSKTEVMALGGIENWYNTTDYGIYKQDTTTDAHFVLDYKPNAGKFVKGDKAVVFTNVVVPKDWNNEQMFILDGSTYTGTGADATLTAKGQGYQVQIKAYAVQYDNITQADAYKEIAPSAVLP